MILLSKNNIFKIVQSHVKDY